MTFGRRFLFALLLSTICCCARAPVAEDVPDRPFIFGQIGESTPHLLARILTDACTSAATDEDLIEHARFLFQTCHLQPDECLRMVCVHLDDEAASHKWQPRVRPAVLR